MSSQVSQSLKQSLWFGVLVLGYAVFAFCVAALPLPILWRGVILGLATLFLLAVAWHQRVSNWEARAKRTAATSLSVLGSMLIAKPIVSRAIQGLGLTGDVVTGAETASSYSVRLLLALADTPWQLDLGLALVGVAALVSVLVFLRARAPTTGDAAPIQESTEYHRGPRYTAFDTYDSDLPPLVDVWVGRASELALLRDQDRGVVAITGIGGQGKSALAATFLKRLRETSKDIFWDWRDCKEQADRFRLQLLSVLEHITDGRVPAAAVADADVAWLAHFFFKQVQDRRGVIVFDNVDHYVDVTNSLFTSTVSTFIDEALRVPHNLLIIFTCRPRISYASVRFREVYLRGLDLQETIELFERKTPGTLAAATRKAIDKLHALTEGHPLWLNIIASQVARKPDTAAELVSSLTDGSMDDLSKAMLRGIWNTLDDRQRSILLCMAELPRALEASLIFEYVHKNVGTHNRFDRSFRALRAISLITEKAAEGSDSRRFDLHPMVRAFVRSEHRNATERDAQLDHLLTCCRQIVVRLKSDASSIGSIVLLEHVTTQAELELARGQTAECVDTLVATCDSLVSRGVAEEFIRIGKLALQRIDWSNPTVVDNDNLDVLMKNLAHIMVESGRSDEFATYTERYAGSVKPGTARYVGLCDIRTYVSWIRKDYDDAIKWGERGETIKKQSGLDTSHDTSHHLALARRDAGQVEQALPHFLYGHSVEEILSVDHVSSGRDASFFGNIGRCLALRGDWTTALRLYARSYDLLEKTHQTPQQQLNSGYAALWIGTVLQTLGKPDQAFRFLKRAHNIWSKRAPMLSETNLNELKNLEARVDRGVTEATKEEVDVWCGTWIAGILANDTNLPSILVETAQGGG